MVFYKSWMCIVGLGLLNGLVLLPVLMSLVGPLPLEDEQTDSDSTNSCDKKQEPSVTNDNHVQTQVHNWNSNADHDYRTADSRTAIQMI